MIDYNISKSRKFYDLCRKYKFYYKRYEEIKHLDKCYWSKYIHEAYKEAEEDLNKITEQIIIHVLSEFCWYNNVSVNVEREMQKYYTFEGCYDVIPGEGHYHVCFDDKKLFNIIRKMGVLKK